jgi:hypothetical protein
MSPCGYSLTEHNTDLCGAPKQRQGMSKQVIGKMPIQTSVSFILRTVTGYQASLMPKYNT